MLLSPLVCGVLQGSIWVLVIFNLYRKLLGETTWKSELACPQDAEDTFA